MPKEAAEKDGTASEDDLTIACRERKGRVHPLKLGYSRSNSGGEPSQSERRKALRPPRKARRRSRLCRGKVLSERSDEGK